MDEKETDERQWREVATALAAGQVLGAERGEIFETHISYVVVGEKLAYKLKKPVKMPFLDYSTKALRREMCEREQRLNARLAPELYRGVRGIRRTTMGFELCAPDDPGCTEHTVVMRRVDHEETLEWQVDAVTAKIEDVAATGHRLARFHRMAAPAPFPAGTPQRLEEWAQQRFSALRNAPPGLLDAGRVDAACRFLSRWLLVSAPHLRRRLLEGHVRDGHGDLRLEHIVLRNGIVEVLDCVEFDDALRCNDVLADLSFLAMELQYADREDLTRTLLDAWRDAGGPLEERLLWGYASSRALVRVEVGAARVAQLLLGPPTLEVRLAEERTQALLELAARLSWRAREPASIVFAGLSGSGKTTISKALAKRWGLKRLSSDEIRKRLVGVGRNEAALRLAYEDYVSESVYERLGREAGREIASGRSVVVDGTFRRPLDAQKFVRAFRSAGAVRAPHIIACCASPEVLRERVGRRSQSGGSDAGPEVLETQISEYGTGGPGISDAVPISTAGPLHDTIELVEEAVLDLTVGSAPAEG